MDYYNDIEPYAAEWLRNLSAANHIPFGAVDTRSILEITSDSLAQYRRAHFFAGIGGWALALKMAGWPEGVPVWTGSCPCQPFSIAGKKKGEQDERHLWPAFRDLIWKRRPAVVFGEQVASPDGREWLSGVRTDLERLGYRFGAADLCAAGVGAPHIRQRLYWVADTAYANWGTGVCREEAATRENGFRRIESPGGCADGRMADAESVGLRPDCLEPISRGRERAAGPDGLQVPVGVGLASCAGLEERPGNQDGQGAVRDEGEAARSRGAWSDFGVIECSDQRSRRVGSGVFPLAHGVPARVGKLRAYGNAIVPEVAALFVQAYIESLPR